jgi:hypothetical protein
MVSLKYIAYNWFITRVGAIAHPHWGRVGADKQCGREYRRKVCVS